MFKLDRIKATVHTPAVLRIHFWLPFTRRRYGVRFFRTRYMEVHGPVWSHGIEIRAGTLFRRYVRLPGERKWLSI